MTDTIHNVNGFDLPTTPWDGAPDIYSQPIESRRWIHYENGDACDMHILFVGMCGCDNCDYSLWSAPEWMPQTGDVGQVVARQGLAATRADLVEHGVISEDWDEDWLPALATYCVTRSNRAEAAVRHARDDGTYRLIEWPRDIFTTYIEEHERKVAAERAAIAEYLEPYPVDPQEGAYVWVDGEFLRFDSWTEDGQIMTTARPQPFDPASVLVATAAVYGVPHENAVLVPGSGITGAHALVKCKRYSRYNVTVEHLDTEIAATYAINYLAVLVPPLNPATEPVEDRAVRLDRELRRLQETMHRRMVAEGEARNWCGEFDPILDSSGLKPRKPKTTVRGTITFEYKVETPLSQQTLTKLAKGSLDVANHISTSSMKVTHIEQDEPIFTPVLS